MADRPLSEIPLTQVELNEVLHVPASLRAWSDFLGRALPQLVLAQARAERAEASCERLRAERNAVSSPADLVKLADELDEDNQATAARTVRAAATTMTRMGAAWARLVRAERAYIGGAALGDVEGSIREYEAAKLSLRDLGVDVDALLGDGR